MKRLGLIGESSFVQRSEEPISASISGEDAPCSIATVSSRCEAYHKHARSGIAKAWNGLAPIFVIREPPHFLDRHSLAPLDEPRTEAAGYNAILQ
jgi:hypothetical protein